MAVWHIDKTPGQHIYKGITSLPSEDSVAERRRKLDFLEMQEELIKGEEAREEEELAKKKESTGVEEDVDLKEMTLSTARLAQEQARERVVDKKMIDKVFVGKVKLIRPNDEDQFFDDKIRSTLAWLSKFIVMCD